MPAKASELLALARAELLVREDPPGSNCVKYNTAYYGRAVSGAAFPWCCVFLWWLFRRAGAPELFCGGGRTASCGTLAAFARENGLWVTGGYRPGDLVFFRFSGTAVQHVGIVEQNRGAAGLVTIEGNTGAGDDANGGQVQRRARPLSLVAGGYRPQYEEESNVIRTQTVEQTVYEYLTDVPEKFRPVIGTLMTAGIILGDGSDPGGNGDRIDLTSDQVRTLLFLYRGGGFDRKLLSAGLSPAVPGA